MSAGPPRSSSAKSSRRGSSASSSSSAPERHPSTTEGAVSSATIASLFRSPRSGLSPAPPLVRSTSSGDHEQPMQQQVASSSTIAHQRSSHLHNNPRPPLPEGRAGLAEALRAGLMSSAPRRPPSAHAIVRSADAPPPPAAGTSATSAAIAAAAHSEAYSKLTSRIPPAPPQSKVDLMATSCLQLTPDYIGRSLGSNNGSRATRGATDVSSSLPQSTTTTRRGVSEWDAIHRLIAEEAGSLPPCAVTRWLRSSLTSVGPIVFNEQHSSSSSSSCSSSMTSTAVQHPFTYLVTHDNRCLDSEDAALDIASLRCVSFEEAVLAAKHSLAAANARTRGYPPLLCTLSLRGLSFFVKTPQTSDKVTRDLVHLSVMQQQQHQPALQDAIMSSSSITGDVLVVNENQIAGFIPLKTFLKRSSNFLELVQSPRFAFIREARRFKFFSLWRCAARSSRRTMAGDVLQQQLFDLHEDTAPAMAASHRFDTSVRAGAVPGIIASFDPSTHRAILSRAPREAVAVRMPGSKSFHPQQRVVEAIMFTDASIIAARAAICDDAAGILTKLRDALVGKVEDAGKLLNARRAAEDREALMIHSDPPSTAAGHDGAITQQVDVAAELPPARSNVRVMLQQRGAYLGPWSPSDAKVEAGLPPRAVNAYFTELARRKATELRITSLVRRIEFSMHDAFCQLILVAFEALLKDITERSRSPYCSADYAAGSKPALPHSSSFSRGAGNPSPSVGAAALPTQMGGASLNLASSQSGASVTAPPVVLQTVIGIRCKVLPMHLHRLLQRPSETNTDDDMASFTPQLDVSQEAARGLANRLMTMTADAILRVATRPLIGEERLAPLIGAAGSDLLSELLGSDQPASTTERVGDGAIPTSPDVSPNARLGDHFSHALHKRLAGMEQYKDLTGRIVRAVDDEWGNAQAWCRRFNGLVRTFLSLTGLEAHHLRVMAYQTEADGSHAIGALLSRIHGMNDELHTIDRRRDLREGLFCIDASAFVTSLAPAPARALSLLSSTLPLIAKERTVALTTELEETCFRYACTPTCVADFAGFLEHHKRTQSRLPDLDQHFDELRELYITFAAYPEIEIPPDDMLMYQQVTVREMARLHEFVGAFDDRRALLLRGFELDLARTVQECHEHAAALVASMKQPFFADDRSDPQRAVERLAAINSELIALRAMGEECISYQLQFGVEASVIDSLRDAHNLGNEMHRLWQGTQRWLQWTEELYATRLKALDLGTVRVEIDAVLRAVAAAERIAGPTSVSKHLRDDAEQLTAKLPLLDAVRNPRLTVEHEARIDELLQLAQSTISPSNTIRPILQSNDTTVGQLLLMSIPQELLNDIILVATAATQETMIENELADITALWTGGKGKKPVSLTLVPYKAIRDLGVLGPQTDAVWAALDESSVRVSGVLSNRYAKGTLLIRAQQVAHDLEQIRSTLTLWVDFQGRWMYLEGIFALVDIARQWPQEEKQFRSVDVVWRDLMKRTLHVPSVYQHAVLDKGNFEALRLGLQQLDELQVAIEARIEAKRRAFPRFYFMFNDDVVDVLAQVRHPERVRPHLAKMFDGAVDFDLKGTADIVAVRSAEGEVLPLIKEVKAKGDVYAWLGQLEQRIADSLKEKTARCLEALTNSVRKVEDGDSPSSQMDRLRSWIFAFPSQLTQLCLGIVFAADVDAALGGVADSRVTANTKSEQYPATSYTTDSKEITQRLQRRLNDAKHFVAQLASLVRDAGGGTAHSLTPLQRRAIASLITIAVHQREVVAQLVAVKVQSVSSFQWQRELRPRWVPHLSDVVWEQLSYVCDYGFEYIGAPSRLVQTPVTDRIFLTVTLALKEHLGAAPSGPAGTGKTETIKDLARTLARTCVVFNCSDGVTYRMMERLFSGLCQCGAWCCLDEFNRTSIEVLSVVASQLREIQFATSQRLDCFSFQGASPPITLKYGNVGIFVTMNPTYAGRTELPDNLQALFRPVAVVVPDYRAISEVILFAEGFDGASQLAVRLTTLFALLSDQLSAQPHYDFGLRALKTVLTVAGEMQARATAQAAAAAAKADGTMSASAAMDAARQRLLELAKRERRVLIKAITDCTESKLTAADAVLFAGLLSNAFGGETEIAEGNGSAEGGDMEAFISSSPLSLAIEWASRFQHLEIVPYFKSKIGHLLTTLRSRFGTIIVGAPGTAKTTLRRCVQAGEHFASTLDARGRLTTTSGGGCAQIEINPKAMPYAKLFGRLTPLTGEWQEGVLVHHVMKILRAAEKRLQHDVTLGDDTASAAVRSLDRRRVVDAADYLVASKGGDQDTLMSAQLPGDEGALLCERTWIAFDGHIDTLWVESLNSVLDDSRLLCLDNGLRLRIPDTFRFLFEVSDLNSASPATVSRCGIVFVDSIDLAAVTASWTRSSRAIRRAGLQPDAILHLKELILVHVPKLMEFLVKRTAGAVWKTSSAPFAGVASSSISLSLSPLQILESVLAVIDMFLLETESVVPGVLGRLTSVLGASTSILLPHPPGSRPQQQQQQRSQRAKENPFEILSALFASALCWGGSAHLKHDDAEAFDFWARDELSELAHFPNAGLVVDYTFDATHPRLIIHIRERLALFERIFGAGAKPAEAADIAGQPHHHTTYVPEAAGDLIRLMFVPTPDNARPLWLSTALARHGRSALFIGAAQCGKSSLLRAAHRVLAANATIEPQSRENSEKSESAVPAPLQFFSLRLATVMTTDELQSRTDKALRYRGSKSSLGKPGHHVVIFIDDANLPGWESAGASPAHEWLRQLTTASVTAGASGGGGGYHDTKTFERCTFSIPCTWIAASGTKPPTSAPTGMMSAGGGGPLPRRWSRHASVIHVPPATGPSTARILNAVIERFAQSRILSNAESSSTAASPSRNGSNGGEMLSLDVKGALLAVGKAVADALPQLSERFAPTAQKPYLTISLANACDWVRAFFSFATLHTLKGDPKLAASLAIHEWSRIVADRLDDERDAQEFNDVMAEALRRCGATQLGTHAADIYDEKSPSVWTTLTAERADDSFEARASLRVPESYMGLRLTCEQYTTLIRQHAYGLTATPASGGAESAAKSGGAGLALDRDASSVANGSLVFDDLALNVFRVARLFRLPHAHLALLGLPGSGRRTLVRLAAALCGATVESFAAVPMAVGAATAAAAATSTTNRMLEMFRSAFAAAAIAAGVEDRPVVAVIEPRLLGNVEVAQDLALWMTSSENDLVSTALFSAEDRDRAVTSYAEAIRSKGLSIADALLEEAAAAAATTTNNTASSAHLAAEKAAEAFTSSDPATRTESNPAVQEDPESAAARLSEAAQHLRDSQFARFLRAARRRLHVVFIGSQGQGAAWSTAIAVAPGLLTCTTVVVRSWSASAFREVGTRRLTSLLQPEDRSAIPSLTSAVVEMHESASLMCAQLPVALRPSVSPATFLDCLSRYASLLRERSASLRESKRRAELGVRKMADARNQVGVMEQRIRDMEPLLAQKEIRLKALTEDVTARAKLAADVAAIVQGQRAIALEEAQVAEALRADAQSDLDKAMPELLLAQEALRALDRQDIEEIRKYPIPPKAVMLTMEAVLTVLKEKKVSEWANAKAIIGQPKFRDRLFTCRVEDLDDMTVARLQRFVLDPDFNPEKVGLQGSGACRSLCMWVLAMERFYHVFKRVEPKRRTKEAAEKVAAAAAASLKDAEAKLAAAEAQLAHCQSLVQQAEDDLKTLTREIDRSKRRLNAAATLLSCLHDESERWAQNAVRFASEIQHLPGTLIVAAAAMVYGSPLPVASREKLCRELVRCACDSGLTVVLCSSGNASSSPAEEGEEKGAAAGHLQPIVASASSIRSLVSTPFRLTDAVASPVELRDWHLQSLPNDPASEDNAITVRWCTDFHGVGSSHGKRSVGTASSVGGGSKAAYIIDPEGQALRWLIAWEGAAAVAAANPPTASSATSKTMGNPRNATSQQVPQSHVLVLRYGADPTIGLKLRGALSSGRPVILRDAPAMLDPVILPYVHRRTCVIDGRPLWDLGNNELVDFDPGFHIYLITSDPYPKCPPELFVLTQVIRFSVTPSSLEQQILSDVVSIENASVEEALIANERTAAETAKKIAALEARLLVLLDASDPYANILDNDELISDLQRSGSLTEELKVTAENLVVQKRTIDIARNRYQPLAERITQLYCAGTAMASLSRMYAMKLDFACQLYRGVLATPTKLPQTSSSTESHGADITGRVRDVMHRTTEAILGSINRYLTTEHRPIYGLLAALALLSKDPTVDARCVDMLFHLGGSSGGSGAPGPSGAAAPGAASMSSRHHDWLPPGAERRIAILESSLPHIFAGLGQSMSDDPRAWRDWACGHMCYRTAAPPIFRRLIGGGATATTTVPGQSTAASPPANPFTSFSLQRIVEHVILVAALAPSTALHACEELCSVVLATRTLFAEQSLLSRVRDAVSVSDSCTPMLLITAKGSDVSVQELIDLASRHLKAHGSEWWNSDALLTTSLGQGQEARADYILQHASKTGRWALLQNVHLARSYCLGPLMVHVNTLHEHGSLYFELNPAISCP